VEGGLDDGDDDEEGGSEKRSDEEARAMALVCGLREDVRSWGQLDDPVGPF
jgi:hypothetical protein